MHIASEAGGTRDEELQELATTSAMLLCHERRRRYPDCQQVCIKFRFQLVFLTALLRRYAIYTPRKVRGVVV